MASLFQQHGIYYVSYYKDGQRFKKTLKTRDKSVAKAKLKILTKRLNGGVMSTSPSIG